MVRVGKGQILTSDYKEYDWLGESVILWAAGRILCLVCGNAEYCDGSYNGFYALTGARINRKKS